MEAIFHPEAGAPLPGEFRKRIVLGFPFSIIYRVWDDCIYLVGVAHHHRRRRYWRVTVLSTLAERDRADRR